MTVRMKFVRAESIVGCTELNVRLVSNFFEKNKGLGGDFFFFFNSCARGHAL